jgi:2-octaprenylphenol hydroxylase
MKTDFDIVIVGAGMVGACAAALAVRSGLAAAARIALIDARPPAAPASDADIDLRVSAISRATERILAACGVWDTVRGARTHPYERMTVWDEGSAPEGAGAVHFDAAELGEPNLGYIVENRWLQWQLFDAAARAGVAIFRQVVASLEPGGAHATLALLEGRSLSARLVIGADGADSAMRRLAGIETRGWGYAQEALVTHVRTERPHQDTAAARRWALVDRLDDDTGPGARTAGDR